jgi:hypothetical protein
MKTKHSITIILFMATAMLFSCRKAATETPVVTNDMASAAVILESAVRTGPITEESDEEGIALDFNNGKTYIILMKMPGGPNTSLPNMASAQVITSQDGAIVKDLESGKTYLFPNNDTESIRKFESARLCFKGEAEVVTIYGVTVFNS